MDPTNVFIQKWLCSLVAKRQSCKLEIEGSSPSRACYFNFFIFIQKVQPGMEFGCLSLQRKAMGLETVLHFGACALCLGGTAFHLLTLAIYSLPIENPAKKPILMFISKSKMVSLFFSLTHIPAFLSLVTILLYHSYLLFETFSAQLPLPTTSSLLALSAFYNLLLMWVTRCHYVLLVKDVDAVMTLEGNFAIHDLLAWEPPSKSFFDRLVAPGRMFLDYEVGWEYTLGSFP